jgi:hypothetical protein
MKFPIWLEIICDIFWIIVIILIFRGLYKNYFINVFSRRKTVRAELISKVREEYYETKFYNSVSRGIQSPASGLYVGNKGIAYRLYFKIQNKVIELDVDEATFQALPETGFGLLDYKGNIYFSFNLETGAAYGGSKTHFQ